MTDNKIANERLRWWLYVAGVVVAFLPVMIWRDFTPSNELRYLSIVDEALRNGDLFCFHNHGVVYADKPPLYFWLMMLCRVVAGKHCMWLLGMFSLIPAIITVGVMDRWTRNMLSMQWREGARLMLITSGLFAGLAFTLRQDMLMTMFIVLTLRCFYDMYSSHESRSDVGKNKGFLLGFLVFMALFSKGPIGVMMPLLVIVLWLLLKGKIKNIGKYIGWRFWLVLAGLTALWFLLAAREGGWGYVHNLCFHQTMDRAVSAFTHNRPFWYYMVAIWYCLLPWSLLVIGVAAATFSKKKKHGELSRFFALTTLVTLVMLSCISGKLQVYMLPIFPFIVYWCALNVATYEHSAWAKSALGVISAVLVCLIPAIHVLPTLKPELFVMTLNAWIYAGCYALAVASFMAIVLMWGRSRGMALSVKVLAIGVLVAVFCAGFALPRLGYEIGYSKVCHEALLEGKEKENPEYYAYKMYRPENMDALLNAPVKIIDDRKDLDAIDWKRGVVIAPDSVRSDFFDREIHRIAPFILMK